MSSGRADKSTTTCFLLGALCRGKKKSKDKSKEMVISIANKEKASVPTPPAAAPPPPPQALTSDTSSASNASSTSESSTPESSEAISQTVPQQQIISYDQDFIQPDAFRREKNITASGSFGRVYKAIWLNATVIVKTFRYKIGIEESDSAKEKYSDCENEREIMRLLTLAHAPNIVHYYGYSKRTLEDSREEFSLLMQHIPQGSLGDYMSQNKSTPLDWRVRYKIMQDVINAVAFLHSLDPQIIHRDIKAYNILLDENFNAFLCDFGLSVKLSTLPTDTSGTPPWMAPEIWRKQIQTPKVDVYSFAITMWEITEWKIPFADISDAKISTIVLEGERPPISITCHRKIKNLMLWGFHSNPANRPSSRTLKEELSSPIETISNQLEYAPLHVIAP